MSLSIIPYTYPYICTSIWPWMKNPSKCSSQYCSIMKWQRVNKLPVQWYRKRTTLAPLVRQTGFGWISVLTCLPAVTYWPTQSVVVQRVLWPNYVTSCLRCVGQKFNMRVKRCWTKVRRGDNNREEKGGVKQKQEIITERDEALMGPSLQVWVLFSSVREQWGSGLCNSSTAHVLLTTGHGQCVREAYLHTFVWARLDKTVHPNVSWCLHHN